MLGVSKNGIAAGVDWTKAQQTADIMFNALVEAAPALSFAFPRGLMNVNGETVTVAADFDVVMARAMQLLSRQHPEVVCRPRKDAFVIAWRYAYDVFAPGTRDFIKAGGGEVVPVRDSQGMVGIAGEREDSAYEPKLADDVVERSLAASAAIEAATTQAPDGDKKP